jgi:hypothetical protein
MKKLRLELNDLRVTTFETALAQNPRGTVAANDSGTISLPAPEDTCGYSCLDPNSCAGTCACSGPHC